MNSPCRHPASVTLQREAPRAAGLLTEGRRGAARCLGHLIFLGKHPADGPYSVREPCARDGNRSLCTWVGWLMRDLSLLPISSEHLEVLWASPTAPQLCPCAYPSPSGPDGGCRQGSGAERMKNQNMPVWRAMQKGLGNALTPPSLLARALASRSLILLLELESCFKNQGRLLRDSVLGRDIARQP